MDLNQRIFRLELMAMMVPDREQRRRVASHHRYARIIGDYRQRETIRDALENQRLEREQVRSASSQDRRAAS